MTELTATDYVIFSDLYKDVYGSRPHGLPPFESYEQYAAEFDRLLVELEYNQGLERRAEERAVARFEDMIREYEEIFPRASEADIIRYISDAENAGNDTEYLEYLLGLPYGYIKNRNA